MSETDKVVLLLAEQADQLWRLEQLLLDHGYAVLSAVDRIQALEHLSSSVVIDLMLVDEPFAGPLTGAALIEACLPLRPLMRVLVLTQNTERSTLHAQAYPVLLKPVGLEELGLAIAVALRSPPVQPWL
ncbi:Response regulator receiver domain-containing protein [Pseudomonas delhiensis]|uniref:Response regulator receiver domain-containing protein n=1 Tax=Pseudomonas delhiensis TaxID=366289 RepID=A0A239LVY1_9PSED|nr:response regulator [Pseudomonas delhiensis]SDI24824.1 Response regulator receiver domain-containing protein [Pseudomonas delhiensis]SNT34686.1 Response regulator receiver domain-containing protein [Pseudomonas delhiensis]